MQCSNGGNHKCPDDLRQLDRGYRTASKHATSRSPDTASLLDFTFPRDFDFDFKVLIESPRSPLRPYLSLPKLGSAVACETEGTITFPRRDQRGRL